MKRMLRRLFGHPPHAEPTMDTRRTRLEALEAEAAAHLPILPLAATHLKEISAEIGEAVVGITSAFRGMAARAQQGATQQVGGAGAETVTQSITTSRHTLEALLGQVERQGENSRRAVERMTAIEAAIARIDAALGMIDEVARTTKCIAVNAKIEAVRVGEAGKGFGVVAGEITSLARQSEQMRDSIQAILGEVRGGVRSTAEELETATRADLLALERSRRDVEGALGGLEAAHGAMRESLAASIETSRALGADIGQAVMRLQFQDRTAQRIEHVVASLATVREALAGPLEALASDTPAEVAARRAEVLRGLERSYTMEAERQAQVRALEGGSAAAEAEVPVELF